MAKFVLTAELSLKAPKNVSQVVNQIQQQLNGVNVNVNLQNSSQAVKDINNITQASDKASTAASKIGKSFAASVRRFSAMAIATRAVGLFTNTLGAAIKESIAFERELIKISQVTNTTIANLGSLTKEITNLSTGLGVSSSSLLSVSRILAQTGLSARDTQTALATLARTELAPTFDNISQTAEGAVAILNQFGQGAGALEAQLGSLNAVAGQFAVEAGDLVSVIRRTGGVFKSAGGDLNELIALFTSVRSTTRESAESIATGLRTIFTRIQRPETIEYLKQFGVELVDLQGKFVGPYEAIKRLSSALAGLGEGDLTFVQIAEELGGFRQIGKVLPLLQQFTVAQKALAVAQKGQSSLTTDAAKAQAALAVQITKVKEEFLALVRGISDSTAFQVMADTVLTLASSLIKLADTLKPILPLLTAFAGIKIAKGLASGIGSVIGGKKFNDGGRVHAFATGGLVPGYGKGDKVKAMLSPGEFVMKKTAVDRIGVGNLAAMNSGKDDAQGYAKGGKINIDPGKIGGFFLAPEQGDPRNYSISEKNVQITNKQALSKLGYDFGPELSDDEFFFQSSAKDKAKLLGRKKSNTFITKMTSSSQARSSISQAKKSTKQSDQVAASNFEKDFSSPETKKRISQAKNTTAPKNISLSGSIVGFFPGKDDLQNGEIATAVNNSTRKAIEQGVESASSAVSSVFPDVGPINVNQGNISKAASKLSTDKQVLSTMSGYIFEGLIQALTGAQLEGGQAVFDFPASSISDARPGLKRLFTSGSEGIDSLVKADAKRTASTSNFSDIADKLVRDINKGDLSGVKFQKFNRGGIVPGVGNGDTVKTVLNDGDFVIQKPSVESLGAENVKKLMRGYSGGGNVDNPVDALVTPGELIIPKEKARQIGYGKLSKINKTGKYATGGIVGRFASGGAVQRFAGGGTSRGGGFTGIGAANEALFSLSAALSYLTPVVDENSTATQKATAATIETLQGLSSSLLAANAAISLFGANVKAVDLAQLAGGGGGKISAIAGRSVRRGASAILPKSAANLSIGLGRATSGLTKLLGPIGATVGAIALLNKGFTNLYDQTEKLKKSISEGDVSTAGSTTREQAFLENRNTSRMAMGGTGATFGALIGTAIAPGIGTAIGAALGGGLGAIIGSITTESGAENLAVGLGSNTSSSRVAMSEASAGAIAFSKALETSTKNTSKALESFAAGTVGLAEVLASAQPAFNEFAEQEARGKKAIKENRGNLADVNAGTSIARDVFSTLSFGAIESTATRNERIFAENEATRRSTNQQRSELSQSVQPVINATMRNVIESGGDFQQFRNTFGEENIGNLDRETASGLQQAFVNLQAEFNKTQARLRGINLGFNNVSGAAQAAAVKINNLGRDPSSASTQLENSIDIINAAMTEAAANIDSDTFKGALDRVIPSLEKFGASTKQVQNFKNVATAFSSAQAGFASATGKTKIRLSGRLNRQSGSPQEQRKILAEEVANFIPDGTDPGIVDQIKNVIANAELNPGDMAEIIKGNFAPLQKILSEEGKKAIGPALEGAVEPLIQSLQGLTSAIDKQLSAQNKLYQAQSAMIAASLEASKNIADFGGPALTPQKRRGFIVEQANVAARDAGLQPLRTGSADELKLRNQQIRNRQATIGRTKQIAATGIDTNGRQVTDAERQRAQEEVSSEDFRSRENALRQAADSQIQVTRDLIQAKKDEIAIAQAKNAAEKKAIDALLSGNREEFFNQMAAEGATAAAATGNIQLMRQFGASDYGRASQNLDSMRQAGVTSYLGQDISGLQQSVVTMGGIMAGLSTNMARQFGRSRADTTPEIQQLQAEGRDLSAQLQNATLNGVQQATIDVRNAQIITNQAQEAVKVATRSSGGIVYASKGQYVNYQPRGTDTVPAMLTPGEFVVNAKATRSNRSLLESINSGKNVEYSSSGGIISPTYLAKGTSKILSPILAGALGSTGEETGVAGKYGTNIAQLGVGVAGALATGVATAPAISSVKQAASQGLKTGLTAYSMANVGSFLDKAGYTQGYGSAVGTAGDVALGAKNAAPAFGATSSVAGGLAAYGGLVATDLAGEAVSLAINPEAALSRYNETSNRQVNQGYATNVGENLLNPGRATMQLGQSSAGLISDVRDSFSSGSKVEEMERNRRIRKGSEALQDPNSQVNIANDLLNNTARRYSKGGPIYANKGMLVPYQPRGTDTVPAMLTPGEFVINRQAAQNNLPLLQSINNGGPLVQNMSRGGAVKYLQGGGMSSGGYSSQNTPPQPRIDFSPIIQVLSQVSNKLDGINNNTKRTQQETINPSSQDGPSIELDTNAMSSFQESLNIFAQRLSENVANLNNLDVQLAVAPADVNVNMVDGGILNSINQFVRNEMLSAVAQEIGNYRVGEGGRLSRSSTSLS